MGLSRDVSCCLCEFFDVFDLQRLIIKFGDFITSPCGKAFLVINAVKEQKITSHQIVFPDQSFLKIIISMIDPIRTIKEGRNTDGAGLRNFKIQSIPPAVAAMQEIATLSICEKWPRDSK
jgi:hypothetical protein